MERYYKAIIERRRPQLLEDVTWSSKVIAKLLDRGLVTKAEWKQIQLQKEDNHSYLLLAAVEKCKAPDAFATLCDILNSTPGNKMMAESLLFDKSRINWDFEQIPETSSIPEYLDVLNDEILRPLLDEGDPFRQQAMLEAGRQRVSKLTDFLRIQKQNHEHFILDLFSTIDKKKECKEIISKNQKGNKSLTKLEESEVNVQRKLISLIDHFKQEVEAKTTKLQDLVSDLEEVASIKKEATRSVASAKPDDKSLRDQIKKQDREINKLRSQISTAERDNYLVRKIDAERMIRLQQPYLRRKSTDRLLDETEGDDDVGLKLCQNTQRVVDMLETLKKRLRETSERVSDLEREKGSAKLVLGVGLDSEELSHKIQSRVDDMNERISGLESENKEQQERIKSLKAENLTLQGRNEGLQQEIYNLVAVEKICTTGVVNNPPPRPRRGSLPAVTPIKTLQTPAATKLLPTRTPRNDAPRKTRVSSSSSSASTMSTSTSSSSENASRLDLGRKTVVPHKINILGGVKTTGRKN